MLPFPSSGVWSRHMCAHAHVYTLAHAHLRKNWACSLEGALLWMSNIWRKTKYGITFLLTSYLKKHLGKEQIRLFSWARGQVYLVEPNKLRGVDGGQPTGNLEVLRSGFTDTEKIWWGRRTPHGKLVRKAGSVVGAELESWTTVAEGRSLNRLLSITENPNHPVERTTSRHLLCHFVTT